MRDANRIEKIMSKIGMIWLENPDLRFGQLVSNLFYKMGHSDMFYVEDDELEKFLDNFLDKARTEKISK